MTGSHAAALVREDIQIMVAVFLCSALLAFGYAAPATAAAPVKEDYFHTGAGAFHTGAGARYLERAKGDIVTVPLRGNVNVLMGSGGNIVVLSGSEGKFLVDAGIKPSKDKLQAALKMTENPGGFRPLPLTASRPGS